LYPQVSGRQVLGGGVLLPLPTYAEGVAGMPRPPQVATGLTAAVWVGSPEIEWPARLGVSRPPPALLGLERLEEDRERADQTDENEHRRDDKDCTGDPASPHQGVQHCPGHKPYENGEDRLA